MKKSTIAGEDADPADYPHTEESRRTEGQRRVDALLEIAKRMRIFGRSV
jgi:hypothetical protein